MNIIIHGIGGRMGRELAALIMSGYKGATLTAGVDVFGAESSVPCYKSFEDIPSEVPCDVIIDFSHHSRIPVLLEYAQKTSTPVVIATTGLDEGELACVQGASEVIPVFHAGNMSVGVALLCELAKSAVRTFDDADIEIIEYHHNRKLDAPSGTALMLFNAIKSVKESLFANPGRAGNKKREKNEVGIHAIRSGNIVGRHEIVIGTDAQTITLTHEAHDRILFAEGAVTAAQFLMGRKAGLYGMEDMINER
ncbi:MAG: 4-hydroxy-tetrahydrodipicolinate reductase [Clostridia bacterium]|nr:4-hydroxy-tetrahydrodipicolinate reductase [Clostridia bacterium]